MVTSGTLILIPARLPLPLLPPQLPSAMLLQPKAPAHSCRTKLSNWMICNCMAVTRDPFLLAALKKHTRHAALIIMGALSTALVLLQHQAFRQSLQLSGIPLSALSPQPSRPLLRRPTWRSSFPFLLSLIMHRSRTLLWVSIRMHRLVKMMVSFSHHTNMSPRFTVLPCCWNMRHWKTPEHWRGL